MQYKERFAIIYGILAAAALFSVAFTLLAVFTPYTPVAHKSDLGPIAPKDLVALAEKINFQGAADQGVTILSQTVVKTQYEDKNTLVITLRTKTAEVGTKLVEVTLAKGVWALENITVK